MIHHGGYSTTRWTLPPTACLVKTGTAGRQRARHSTVGGRTTYLPPARTGWTHHPFQPWDAGAYHARGLVSFGTFWFGRGRWSDGYVDLIPPTAVAPAPTTTPYHLTPARLPLELPPAHFYLLPHCHAIAITTFPTFGLPAWTCYVTAAALDAPQRLDRRTDTTWHGLLLSAACRYERRFHTTLPPTAWMSLPDVYLLR